MEQEERLERCSPTIKNSACSTHRGIALGRRAKLLTKAGANKAGEVLTGDVAEALDSLVGRTPERVMLNSLRHCL